MRQRRAMQNLKRRACKACLLARFLGVIASSARIEPMQHFERFAMSRVSLCRELQHESIYHMTSVRGCREPSHAECDNHADGSFTRCPGIHICPYTWRVVYVLRFATASIFARVASIHLMKDSMTNIKRTNMLHSSTPT